MKLLLGLGAALGLGLVGYGVYEATKKTTPPALPPGSGPPAPTPTAPTPTAPTPTAPTPTAPTPAAPVPVPPVPVPPTPKPTSGKLPPRGTMVLLRSETLRAEPRDDATAIPLLATPIPLGVPTIEQVPQGLVLDVPEVRELPCTPPYGPSPPGWGRITFLGKTGWIRLDWAQWLPQPSPEEPPAPPIPGLPSPLPPPTPPPPPGVIPVPTPNLPANVLPVPPGTIRYLAPGDWVFPGRRYRGRAHLSLLERLAPDEVIRAAFEKQGFTAVRLWRDKDNLPKDWPASVTTGSDLFVEWVYQGVPQAATFPPQVDRAWEQG